MAAGSANNRDDEERQLDGLLARGRLSGARRDHIFDAVARSVEPARSPWWRRFVVWPPVAAAVGALWTLVRPTPEYRSGGGGAAGGTIEASCGATLGRCRIGDTMIFRVDGLKSAGRLHARAVPVGAAVTAAEAVVYFPTVDGTAPMVRPSA